MTGGALALGQQTGKLAPGYRADLVELDSDHPLLTGRGGDLALDTWLFAGDRSMVRSVWVGGQRQVVQGRHIHKERFEAPFRRAMKELM